MTDERFSPEPPRLSRTSDAMARLFADAESAYRAPRHEVGAWRRLEKLLNASGNLVVHSRAPKRRHWAALAALAAGLWLAWFGWQRHRPVIAVQSQPTHEPVAAKVTTTTLHLAAGKSQLPDGTEVELAEGTEGSYRADEQRSSLEFDRGRLNIKVAHQREGRHFVVKTQGFEFRVLGTQFCVVTSGNRINLDVTEGRVEVSDATSTLKVVEAGGHWSNLGDSEPNELPAASVAQLQPHLLAPRVDSAPPNPKNANDPTSCRDLLRSGEPTQSEQCYLQIAQGNGLSAEMALYEVARLRRDVLSNPGAALGALDEYERRFASGTLAPEVGMARVNLLARLGRVDEALQASERLLSGSSGRARTVELRLLRGNLLRDKKHDCSAAQAEYRIIESDPTPRGDQAQFARAGCLERLGRKDEAIRAYRSYLGRPKPEFAERARQRLEELQP